MNTPTPRTDAEAYTEEPDCAGTTGQSVSADFARTLERELSDMTARAEAVEAACADKSLALHNLIRTCEQLGSLGYIHSHSKEPICWSPDGELSKAKSAALATPAETRSVIAGLREEVGRLRDDLNHERKTQSGEHLRCIAQRDALIEAGNALSSSLNRHGIDSDLEFSAWEAAVSGAQAGAKGAREPMIQQAEAWQFVHGVICEHLAESLEATAHDYRDNKINGMQHAAETIKHAAKQMADLWSSVDIMADPNCADWHRKDILEKLRAKYPRKASA